MAIAHSRATAVPRLTELNYDSEMARGWESKSVEAQQDAAEQAAREGACGYS